MFETRSHSCNRNFGTRAIVTNFFEKAPIKERRQEKKNRGYLIIWTFERWRADGGFKEVVDFVPRPSFNSL
ncbi:hypothetical protein TNCV_1882361 [Trichonephila clavipes]|nr:hypothetical protein TNCV_1882361 [Trichonephila clavipes]